MKKTSGIPSCRLDDVEWTCTVEVRTSDRMGRVVSVVVVVMFREPSVSHPDGDHDGSGHGVDDRFWHSWTGV